jgi:hypothetical protein
MTQSGQAKKSPEPVVEERGKAAQASGDRGVVYVAMRCPGCRESAGETESGRGIATLSTKRPVRYHECRRCGLRFKSVEE